MTFKLKVLLSFLWSRAVFIDPVGGMFPASGGFAVPVVALMEDSSGSDAKIVTGVVVVELTVEGNKGLCVSSLKTVSPKISRKKNKTPQQKRKNLKKTK